MTGNTLPLEKSHLECFRCEAGNYPVSVAQLVAFKPKLGECKSLFTGEPFTSIFPDFIYFKITTKIQNNRDALTFTLNGLTDVEYDTLTGYTDEHYDVLGGILLMNLFHDEQPDYSKCGQSLID